MGVGQPRDRQLVPLDPARREPEVEVLDELPGRVRPRRTWRLARHLVKEAAREVIPTVRQSEAALVRVADTTRGVLGRLSAAARRLAAATGRQLQDRLEQTAQRTQERLERAGDVMEQLRARLREPETPPASPPPPDPVSRAQDIIAALRERVSSPQPRTPPNP